jgi:hypothetical protein
MVLGNHMVDLDQLDRRLAAAAGQVDGPPPPRVVGGLATKLPEMRRQSSLYVSRGDAGGGGESEPSPFHADDKDLVGLAFASSSSSSSSVSSSSCFEAVGAGGLSTIGPRYVVVDAQWSYLPSEEDDEDLEPNSEDDDDKQQQPAKRFPSQLFIPISHVTAVPDPTDAAGVAAAAAGGGTYTGAGAGAGAGGSSSASLSSSSPSSLWMPRRGEKGLTGRDLAMQVKDAAGFDLDDPGTMVQPSVRLCPCPRPRANPPQRARAEERMNSPHLYGDQLTAPGRISVHSVFGYDSRTMLVQGRGVRRGDRFTFQAPDPAAARRAVGTAFDSLRQADNAANCIGSVLFCCVGRADLFGDNVDATDGAAAVAVSTTGSTGCTDASQFLERFPGAPLAGMFSTSEILDRALVIDGGDGGAGGGGGWGAAWSPCPEPRVPFGGSGGIRISQLAASFALFTGPST